MQMWRKSMELRAQKEFLQPIEALQSSPNGLKIFGNVPDVQVDVPDVQVDVPDLESSIFALESSADL
ncbi:hypothetical protein Bhyg_03413 [Pseudolycoriella hygida]|uniref:Uncharacterized protein n=1 Tax=Pseudolycoriella hygida TaxID=35572 RepID=A0A9Q0S7H1_9DIPT|nr:hypothetical protein Bhyg_03413 [Pseudolycoriella hygida]